MRTSGLCTSVHTGRLMGWLFNYPSGVITPLVKERLNGETADAPGGSRLELYRRSTHTGNGVPLESLCRKPVSLSVM